MGKASSGSTTNAGKRTRTGNSTDPVAKKLLANNRYAVLEDGAEPVIEKKEKVPPFYVKGFPESFREVIYFYINKGLKCTLRMCTEGYKIMVPAMNHYKAVQTILKQHKVEYFSHDIEADKPLKVVLRGLPDMEVNALMEELKTKGLKPLQIHKMSRHNKTRKYRDQLYLVNLEKNSTCLKDLKTIPALFHIVVVWEHYKPVHRDVTQCTNCLLFGHGTKNCHMASRCRKCGQTHASDACELMETADPVCANCGAGHQATSKTCPKRAEFIAIRKRASIGNQPGRRMVPENNLEHFPAITPRRPVTVLPPLPLNNRMTAAAASVPSNAGAPSYANVTASSQRPTPPGLSERSTPAAGISFNRAAADDAVTELLTTEEFVHLLAEAFVALRTCKTRAEQLQAAVSILTKYGP